MRKLLKNKKALSPVVAAIILIAVTVAVSIAVAAWMGQLTFTFMDTEQASITNLVFTGDHQVTATIMNTGTTDIIISSATISGYNITTSAFTITGGSITIAEGTTGTVPITFTAGTNDGFVAGRSYTVDLVSSKANKFTYSETV
ncbi:MAG: hypothetical protein CW716_08150 [Candidatus Bathyarchaeum sp.]|nr:MAG: hypothetical protein CW716_08150 [Candidatus Bathyarchaeum sp.]